MVYVYIYIDFCCIHLWKILMTNKLFIIVVVILLVMTGYMLILSNHTNSINQNTNFDKLRGYRLYIVNRNGTIIFVKSSNISSNVIPDTTSSSYWLIGIALTYPDTWSPYFTTLNGALRYSLTYYIEANGNTSSNYYYLDNGASGTNKAYINGYYMDLLEFPVSQWTNSSQVIINFNLNYIENTNAAKYYVNNLTMTNNFQNIVLQGLPYGNVNSNLSSSTLSATYIFNLFYGIKNEFKLTFSGYNDFSVNINNQTFTTTVGNISIEEKNGTYPYTIIYGSKTFSSNVTIAGKNVNIDIAISIFLSSPTLDFFTYLIVIFIMLITILHFTRGSMIFLSFSSFLFIYIGYKLSIAYFTINLILFFVLIFSALLSYKVFLE